MSKGVSFQWDKSHTNMADAKVDLQRLTASGKPLDAETGGMLSLHLEAVIQSLCDIANKHDAVTASKVCSTFVSSILASWAATISEGNEIKTQKNYEIMVSSIKDK